MLETREWFCGEAWLSYRITEEPRRELQQVGALRTRGLTGWAYWKALWPIHIVVFQAMARKQADRAHALGHRGLGVVREQPAAPPER